MGSGKEDEARKTKDDPQLQKQLRQQKNSAPVLAKQG